ncbi:unnamed protein product [Effrenium voratum]|uniref:Uncharacterized protein n=1 Tax=Effrenium voratum TaxID=2562239 RepID=A0AA36JPU9_9DINO|nr:unnamed protein product [Effrenium voratum]CAJ1413492.1 unnamed protein product [Effrenium voratum]
MQTLKKGASFLSEAKDRLTRARSSSSGDALKLPEGGGPGKSNAFYNCSPQEAHCRKLLVHQEAVAGVVDRYMCAVLYALDDLAAAHENLGAGLQQAGDLVDGAWHGHVEALATALRQARKRSEDQENGFTIWCFKVVTRRAP